MKMRSFSKNYGNFGKIIYFIFGQIMYCCNFVIFLINHLLFCSILAVNIYRWYFDFGGIFYNYFYFIFESLKRSLQILDLLIYYMLTSDKIRNIIYSIWQLHNLLQHCVPFVWLKTETIKRKENTVCISVFTSSLFRIIQIKCICLKKRIRGSFI